MLSKIIHPSSTPIGVFDSGIGGLTVVAALRQLLPHENILYVGDTARVPYGGKSAQTITRYSQEIIDLLLNRRCKMIVVACNTASALALPTLKNFYKIPLQGVIEPGAAAAAHATRSGKIGVIGTRATITSNAYSEAILALQPDATITAQACPLLVPAIEEGWLEDEITKSILHRYLDPLLAKNIDTLVLGCTHYPLLKKQIASVVGPDIKLVDSAENCAETVQELLLKELSLAFSQSPATKQHGKLDVILTDPSQGFLHAAAEQLNLEITSVETMLFH